MRCGTGAPQVFCCHRGVSNIWTLVPWPKQALVITPRTRIISMSVKIAQDQLVFSLGVGLWLSKMVSADVAVDNWNTLIILHTFLSCVWGAKPINLLHFDITELGYLEVTSIKAHSVDFSTAWPRWVHPVDEFLLVVKVYVDDVVEALSGERTNKNNQFEMLQRILMTNKLN